MTSRVVERKVLTLKSGWCQDDEGRLSSELAQDGWRIVAEKVEPEESEAEKLAKELDTWTLFTYSDTGEMDMCKRAAAWIRAHDPDRRKA